MSFWFFIIAFCLAFTLCFFLMKYCKLLSIKVNAIDLPLVDKRKIHNRPIPRLGGLFIFLSFTITYLLFIDKIIYFNILNIDIDLLIKSVVIIIGGFLILLMGIFDDISPLNAKFKFLIQILIATLVVFKGGFVVQNIDVFYNIYLPPFIDKIFTIAWIVLLINAMNLLDGMDGLASGISMIVLSTMIIIGIINFTDISLLIIFLCLILLGSILGFYFYNLPPAKIFMGDSGAQFIGYMLSVLSIYGYKQAVFSSFIIPIIILVIPLLDTILSFFRRIFNHVPSYKPDRLHMHHLVLNNVNSVKFTLLIFYGVSILFSLSAIFYSLDKIFGLIFFIIVFIFSEFLLEYFLIISVYYWPVIWLYIKISNNSKFKRKHHKNILKILRNKKY